MQSKAVRASRKKRLRRVRTISDNNSVEDPNAAAQSAQVNSSATKPPKRKKPSRRRRAAGAAVLRKLHQDPEFCAKRDERGRLRFTERQAEMQRKALAARRGVEVPADLESEWRRLTNKRKKGWYTQEEAAGLLGLSYNKK